MKLIRIFISMMALVFLASCTESIPVFTKVCFTTYHHERIIPHTTIYVKYNAERFPGYDDRSVYDAHFDADAAGHVCIENIPTGIHWFAGFGIDSLIDETVFGSRRINVSWDGYQLDTIIYVSE